MRNMPSLPDVLPQTITPGYTLLSSIVLAILVYVTLAQSTEQVAESTYVHVGIDKRVFLLKGLRQRFLWFQKGPSLIHKAFEEHRNTIFTLPSLDRTSIVLPPRFLQEIRDLPGSIGSNSHATSDFFIGKKTTLDYDIFGHAMIDAVKTQFISKIGSQVGPASNEAFYAFDNLFYKCPEWTPIVVQPTILQLVSQIVSRVVIGSDIGRDPRWTTAVIGYAKNIFGAAVLLKLLPDMLHPLAMAFSPYFYCIHNCRRMVRKLAASSIQQAMAWKLEDPESWKAHLRNDEPTTVDWLVETSRSEESTVAMIAHRLTGVSFGASHTTSNTITNAIFDLANDFERWAPPLRKEIESVLGSNPSGITNADLSKMWKLDSFLKESQRFHPPSKLSVNRKMMESHTLSSGDVLPKNAHVSFAGVPISMSDEYFENAKEFDGFRFERLRSDPKEDHNGLQFTSSYIGSLHFGHGRYMCPGRFMGSLISKLLLIQLLQRYDMKLSGGVRPESIVFFDMDIPDPKYKVLFRDRQV